MADFHRLENPPADYLTGSGGTLPTGYDYINNDPTAAVGTAAGNRAQHNVGPKPSGFNSGTYFLGWRDAGLSANVNRAMHALAENTDHLDNVVRKRRAVPKTTTVTTAGGEAYVQISDWVWVGDSVSDDPTLLVQILQNDGSYAEASFSSGGARWPSQVTDIKDSTGAVTVVGNGWVQNPRIYLDLAAVPQNLLLVYGGMSSIATQSPGDSYEQHHYSSVPWELQNLLWQIKGGSVAGDWYDSPPTSLYDLRARSLQQSYNRWDNDFSVPVPGAGAVIGRGGKALTVESRIGGDLWAPTARAYVDPINACFKSDMRDTAYSGANSRSNWGYGSVGYASYGVRWDIKGKKDFAPSFASFLALDSQFGTSRPVSVSSNYYMTNIPENAAGTLTPVSDGLFEIELSGTGNYPDPFFWANIGGGGDLRTAIVTKKDLLEVTLPGGEKRTFILFALFAGQAQAPIAGAYSHRKALLYPIDAGRMTDIASAQSVSVVWHATTFGVGHGNAASKVTFDGVSSAWGLSGFHDFGIDGVFIASPTPKTNVQSSGNDFFNLSPYQAALTVGADSATKKAISVGQYDHTPSVAAFVEKAFIRGNGDSKLNVVQLLRTEETWSNIIDPAATTVNVSAGSYFVFNDPTVTSGFSKTLEITGLTTGGMNRQNVYVRIYRTTNTVKTFVPTVDGFTNILESADKVLSPTMDGGVYDLYIGRVMGSNVFWSVERWKA